MDEIYFLPRVETTLLRIIKKIYNEDYLNTEMLEYAILFVFRYMFYATKYEVNDLESFIEKLEEEECVDDRDIMLTDEDLSLLKNIKFEKLVGSDLFLRLYLKIKNNYILILEKNSKEPKFSIKRIDTVPPVGIMIDSIIEEKLNSTENILSLKIFDQHIGNTTAMIHVLQKIHKKLNGKVSYSEIAERCIFGSTGNSLDHEMLIMNLKLYCDKDIDLSTQITLHDIFSSDKPQQKHRYDIIFLFPSFEQVADLPVIRKQLFDFEITHRMCTSYLFIYRMLETMSENTTCTFVIHNSFLNNVVGEFFRRKLLQLADITYIYLYSASNSIIHCRKRTNDSFKYTYIDANNNSQCIEKNSGMSISVFDIESFDNSMNAKQAYIPHFTSKDPTTKLFYHKSVIKDVEYYFVSLGPILKYNSITEFQDILKVDLPACGSNLSNLTTRLFGSSMYKTREVSKLCSRNNNFTSDMYYSSTYYRKLMTAGMTQAHIPVWGIANNNISNYKKENEKLSRNKSLLTFYYAPYISNVDFSKIFDNEEECDDIFRIIIPQTGSKFRCFFDYEKEFVCPSMTVVEYKNNKGLEDSIVNSYFWLLSAWFNSTKISKYFECVFAGTASKNVFNMTHDTIKKLPLPCTLDDFIFYNLHENEYVKDIKSKYESLYSFYADDLRFAVISFIEENVWKDKNEKIAFLPQSNMFMSNIVKKGIFAPFLVDPEVDFEHWKFIAFQEHKERPNDFSVKKLYDKIKSFFSLYNTTVEDLNNNIDSIVSCVLTDIYKGEKRKHI